MAASQAPNPPMPKTLKAQPQFEYSPFCETPGLVRSRTAPNTIGDIAPALNPNMERRPKAAPI